MPTIEGAVNKTESIFERFVLPGLALGGGFLSGNVVFQGLADRLASATFGDTATSTNGVEEMFGKEYAGARILAGLVIGVIGFTVYRMGSFMKYIGLYLIGSCLGMLAQGFNIWAPTAVV